MSIVCDTDVLSAFAKIDGQYHSFLSSTAKRFAQKNEVIAWDIPDIMKALWKTGIRSKGEVKVIMDNLEIKDMMIINNKEKILK